MVHAAGSPATDAAGRWSADQANQWYAAQPWPCGFNYVPPAINMEWNVKK